MLFDLSIVLVLMLANGVFSMSEMAIVSARKTRLQEWAEQGNTKARVALGLASSPNDFLSTVQVGITLIGTLAGAFGGSALAAPLAKYIAMVPALQASSEAIAFGIVVAIITFLSLIIGELVPKRLALNSPEQIATTMAGPMQTLAKLTAPIVTLLGFSTEAVLKLLQVRPNTDEQAITEEEIKVLVRQGAEAGMFETAEQDMVERVFRLGDEQANSLLTPRLDITWLDLADSIEINRQKMIDSRHSRFPVCHETLDNVMGVVYSTDVMAQSLSGEPIDLTQLLRQPLLIPESTHALKILEMFKKSGTHIALVVDEYGVIQGLVTLNDVMEVVIGDVPFADNPDEAGVVQREDGSWLVDGMLSIDELKDLLNVDELPNETIGNYQTIAGFVISRLGKIPRSSDHFEWRNFRFEVMDMDGNRVDKVLVVPLRG